MFRDPSAFAGSSAYRLLPFRFRRMPGDEVLVTNIAGEHRFLDGPTFTDWVAGRLDQGESAFSDLESGHFLYQVGRTPPTEPLAVKLRTKKRYIFEGPALHIFVVTLLCNHSCSYCQVSRKIGDGRGGRFDMSAEHALAAARNVLRSPAQSVTVEFQGGEPLLAFETIRLVVETLVAAQSKKDIRFVITTTLHHLDHEIIEFIARHRIHISTSIDGPPSIHNVNRPVPDRDSYSRTVAGIEAIRAVCGAEHVAALTTLTRKSLDHPEAIIDEYVRLGFHTISLRPLSPYGFAAKQTARLDYSVDDYLDFYERALDYLIRVNKEGYPIEETYAGLLLRSILTPFGHGYVDLQSPTGAGFGTWVTNYDGKVYPSDESRMLVEMGDDTFCMGEVTSPYEELMTSPAMQLIAAGAVAESIPGCSECAFVPFCGSDPVDAYRRQGDVIGHRPTSDFCRRQTGLFELLFKKLRHGTWDEKRILESWALGIPMASADASA